MSRPPRLLVALLAAAPLLWPALLNGYPLVFSDTGTYLSQIPHHYLGWDRPPFYSAFLFALDWDTTTWTAIVAQALIAAWVLDATRRGFAPQASPWRTLIASFLLAAVSPLPFVAAELMPDLFTGLMVLAIVLLGLRADCFARTEHAGLAALVAFSVTSHLSNLPIALVLGAVVTCFRRRAAWVFAPVLIGSLALSAVNLVGRGTLALAPYGDIFLLARSLYDGPGMRVLARECPRSGWRLCAWRNDMPPSADEFLWRADSPLNRAGGPKAVSVEAGAIVRAAVLSEPGDTLRAVAKNTARQLTRFASGDGLHSWPTTVTPWVMRDFPAFERAAYAAARQTRGAVLVPQWLRALHWAAAIGGACASALLAAWWWNRDRRRAAVLLACLAALLVNAAVTGALSGPHDRYQSRVMWLPLVLLAVLPRCKLPHTVKLRRAAVPPLGSAFWCAAEAATSGALSFAGAFLLARMIGAAEIGVGAGVTAIHVLLWVGTNAVLADAIVQRAALDEEEAGSAIAAGLLIGFAAAALQGAAFIPLRIGLHDPRLAPMCLALALPLPLVGAAGPVQGLFTRARDYRRLALRSGLGQGAGLAAGLLVAAQGGGAWAIIAQQATVSLAGAAVLLAGGGWRARWAWRPHALAGLFRIGVPLAGSTLILTARYRLFALAVGGVAGPAVLGQVHMAFRLVDTVRELASTAMWRLLLPSLAECQHDRRALLASVDAAVRVIAATLVPLCAALAALTGPMLAAWLGRGWTPAGRAALPLAALAAWMFVTFPGGVAAVAAGAPQYGLRAQAMIAALALLLMLLLRPQTPLGAAAAWLAAHLAVAPYAAMTTARVLGCRPLRPIAAGVPGLALAAAGAAAAAGLRHLFGAAGLGCGVAALGLAAAVLWLRPPVWPARLRSLARS